MLGVLKRCYGVKTALAMWSGANDSLTLNAVHVLRILRGSKTSKVDRLTSLYKCLGLNLTSDIHRLESLEHPEVPKRFVECVKEYVNLHL